MRRGRAGSGLSGCRSGAGRWGLSAPARRQPHIQRSPAPLGRAQRPFRGAGNCATSAPTPAPGRRPAAPFPRDRGQVSIELLGMTPVIILTLVLMWQAVLVGYAFTLAGNAADEGVRAGTAVPRGERSGVCERAALEDLSGAWREGAKVDQCGGTGMVTADVSLRVPVLFPGSIDFPVTVHGHAGTVEEVKN